METVSELQVVVTTTRMGSVHPDPCVECGGRLYLGTTRAGIGYICENLFTPMKCLGNAGANPDGSPMGTPATQNVRMLRTLIHYQLDPLWTQYGGEKGRQKRRELYVFMSEKLAALGLLAGDEEFHLANLNEEQLKAALNIIKYEAPKVFS